jgi:hypothetical protein
MGGGAGESGGSSGSGGSSAQGGSAEGGSATGGSAQGGAPQGGSAGAAGEGGETAMPTRLLLQTGNALFATDPEGAETIEVCPEPTSQVLYDLVDWVNERAIVFRRHVTSPSAGELLRVALDGSECTSLLLNESVLSAYSPAVGGRVLLATNNAIMSELPAPNTGDGAIRITVGLATFALEGSPLAVLAPNGVSDVRIVGEHVVFIGPGAGGVDFFSALPDASSVVAPVPDAGAKAIAAIRGRRVLVNAVSSSDVYAVDADGGNLAALAVGSEIDSGAGFVDDRVFIHRSAPSGAANEYQFDIVSVDMNGGELTPIATSADGELFRGTIGDRIIYERASDIYTARFDGSDALPVTQTPGFYDGVVATVGNRIVFGTGEFVQYFSVLPDGSDLVPLHESSSGLAAIAGDRAVFYVNVGNAENYDLVSVPLTGGEPWLLADAPEPEWLVGMLGTTLVIQRGAREAEAEILRIDADGSRALRLAPSARYVGAVTETCGAVRANNASPNDCAP